MTKIKYQNWSTEIFQGFYESGLYNSDAEYEYNQAYGDELKEGFCYVLKDWQRFTNAVARACVDELWNNLSQKDLIIADIAFESISSPAYYNFETDRLNLIVDCDIPALKKYCFETENVAFAQYLKDNFTSYDGFVSFVPNSYFDFKEQYEAGADNKLAEVMIEFYILRNLDIDAYNEYCYEKATEILPEYMEIDEE